MHVEREGASKKNWVEVVSTAVYLLNCSPTKAVNGKTPYEAWHWRKPNVGHLKVFGSIAYAHIPYEKRRKLNDKNIKRILWAIMMKQKAIDFIILKIRI